MANALAEFKRVRAARQHPPESKGQNLELLSVKAQRAYAKRYGAYSRYAQLPEGKFA
jgi:hypothetical protein